MLENQTVTSHLIQKDIDLWSWSVRGGCYSPYGSTRSTTNSMTQNKQHKFFSELRVVFKEVVFKWMLHNENPTENPFITSFTILSGRVSLKEWIHHFLSVSMALTSQSRFLIWSISILISWFFCRTFCRLTRKTDPLWTLDLALTIPKDFLHHTR